MKQPANYLALQYKLVRQSRKTLFDYCATLDQTDLVNENSSFGRGGSIRNLLVHIANTYEFWIIRNALKKEVVFTDYNSKTTMGEIERLFMEIDKQVDDFLIFCEDSMFETIAIEIGGQIRCLNPFELFTHVITHEFHHKGQVVTLSRHLGYTPVDTDIIR